MIPLSFFLKGRFSNGSFFVSDRNWGNSSKAQRCSGPTAVTSKNRFERQADDTAGFGPDPERDPDFSVHSLEASG